MKQIIKNNLQRVMIALNITLTELIHKCDIPAETIKNIYYGKTDNPRLETLIAICDAIDISIDYLVDRKHYEKDEIELLKHYKIASSHGKAFIQEMAKHEAYYTNYENQQTHERSIVCVEPTGDFQNGVLWDSCKISRITTYLPQVFFGFKIPTHAFLPTYAQGDILLIEHRLPKEGENAVFYKDNKVYVRNFLHSRETGFFTLKAISMDAQDIVIKNLKEFHIVGTIIIPDRATKQENDIIVKDIPLPLDIKELVDNIKTAD